MAANCPDCTLPYLDRKYTGYKPDSEHPDLCCNCFDEMLGMSPKRRSRPRPPGNNLKIPKVEWDYPKDRKYKRKR